MYNLNKKVLVILSGILIGALWHQSVAFIKPKSELRILPNYDIRLDTKSSASFAFKSDMNKVEQQNAISNLQKELGKEVIARYNPNAQVPKHLFSYTGTLTDPKTGTSESIAREFISNHPILFGISDKALADYQITKNIQTAHNGITNLSYQQFYQGLEVFNAQIRVNLNNAGSIISVSANHTPNITGSVDAKLSASAAVIAGAKCISDKVSFIPIIKESSQSLNQKTVFESGVFAEDIAADLIVFPLGSTARPAWRMTFVEKDTPNVYLVLIDAETGDLLYRQNLTKYAASGLVYEESPIATIPPFSSSRVTKLFDGSAVSAATTASPLGWVTDTTTLGNNVRAEEDWDANNSTPGEMAISTTGNFSFTLDLYQDPTTYRNASITNLFWVNNMMHDWLYDLGFTESAGNFQGDNFGRGGSASDYVVAQAQDGSGTDNANFYTPADGSKPRMQMYIFTYTSPRRDSSINNDVPIHEYCHGLSNRLVGIYSLDGVQSGGMGEGWSDWYAVTLLDDYPKSTTNSMVVGAYVVDDTLGIRRYPYSMNTSVNPLTYGDMAGEVHDDGEIWCVTLWEMYKLLVQRYGLDSDTTQPWRIETPYDGRERAWLMVTDAMKLSPDSPTMLDMRDAILLADKNNFAGADIDIIWKVFAKRGMGYSASSNGDTILVTEAFDLPPNTPLLQYASSVIDDNSGNNDGKADAGEQIIMPVTLINRGICEASNISATLTSSSPFITITQNSVTFPDIDVDTTKLSNTPYFAWYSSSTTPITNAGFTLQIHSNYSTSFNYNTTSSFMIPIGGYIVETVAYNWINAESGTQVTLGDDQGTTVNLEFNFKYYDNQYSSVIISSNGYLTFGTTGRAYSNSTIPKTTEPNNAIYVFWDDMNPSISGSTVCYLTSGTAPNRTFTAAWINVPPYGVSGKGTYEVTLYETSGDIICQYQDVAFQSYTHDSGNSATVGIENSDASMGIEYSYNVNDLIWDGLALRFGLTKSSANQYLNSYGSFSVGSDTTHWYFEKYADGTGPGTLSWSESLSGQTGVVKILQAAGEKGKLTQIFSVPTSGWYTAQAKVATDIVTVSKQQKVYLYLQELNSDTAIVGTANEVIQPGNGGLGTASTWRDLKISFYAQNTLLGIQLVAINNSGTGVTGSIYADNLWVTAGVTKATTTVSIPNASFDSGTTNWLISVYADGTGPGTWTGYSGLLLGSQGGGEKGKVSQTLNLSPVGKNIIGSVKVFSSASTMNYTQKVYLYVYCYDSAYSIVIESGNAILQPGKWNPSQWQTLQFGYLPTTIYNAVQVVAINPASNPYESIYFDDLVINKE
ncbi:MAG: M36 family metallopeptidase [bacterium]